MEEANEADMEDKDKVKETADAEDVSVGDSAEDRTMPMTATATA